MSKYTKLLSVAGLACLPGLAFADTSSVSQVLEASGITASGYLSASYQANFNEGSTLGGRTFDTQTDSFKFNQAALTVAKLPTEGFGALVNVIVGDDASVINGSYGDGGGNFNLTQGFVQYAGGGFTVIAGRYVTLAGFEVINDALNPHISRSFLFQNAEPLVHTGIRASYKVNDIASVTLGLNNSALGGFANDLNKQKTVEASLALTPITGLSIYLTDYYGFDENGSATTTTNFFDGVASYAVSDKLSLAVNGDYLTIDAKGGVPGVDVTGVAFYASYIVSDLISLRGRVEVAEVAVDGAPTNKIQTYTGTIVISPAKSFDILAEARLDNSKDDIFPNGANPKDSQGDVAVKVIYKF